MFDTDTQAQAHLTASTRMAQSTISKGIFYIIVYKLRYLPSFGHQSFAEILPVPNVCRRPIHTHMTERNIRYHHEQRLPSYTRHDPAHSSAATEIK